MLADKPVDPEHDCGDPDQLNGDQGHDRMKDAAKNIHDSPPKNAVILANIAEESPLTISVSGNERIKILP